MPKKPANKLVKKLSSSGVSTSSTKSSTSSAGSGFSLDGLTADSFTTVLKSVGLPEYVGLLLKLYGIVTLEDLEAIDDTILDDIVEKVNLNDFGATDFLMQQNQKKYLGQIIQYRTAELTAEPGSRRRGNFQIPPYFRVKLKQQLATHIQKARLVEMESKKVEEEAEKIFQSCELTCKESLESCRAFRPTSTECLTGSLTGLSAKSSTGSSYLSSVRTSTDFSSQGFSQTQNSSQDFTDPNNPACNGQFNDLESQGSNDTATGLHTSTRSSPVAKRPRLNDSITCTKRSETFETVLESIDLTVEKKVLSTLSDLELNQRRVKLCVSIYNKIKKYWSITDYKEKQYELSDVRSCIVKGQIKVNARCLICNDFRSVNIVENRAGAINNYVSHVALHLLPTTSRGKKKVAVQSGQSIKNQLKLSSFFSPLSKPLSSKENNAKGQDDEIGTFDETLDETLDGNEFGSDSDIALDIARTVATYQSDGFIEVVDGTQYESYKPYYKPITSVSGSVSHDIDKLPFTIVADGPDLSIDSEAENETNDDSKGDSDVVFYTEDGSEVSEAIQGPITIEVKQEMLDVALMHEMDVENKENSHKNANKITDKIYSIVVPNRVYRRFNKSFSIDEKADTSIIKYLEEVTKDARLMFQLVEENNYLRSEEKQKAIHTDIMHPKFFEKLNEIKRKKHLAKPRKERIFDDDVMDAALLYFLWGGRKLYETLTANLPLPSLSLVYKRLYDKRLSYEGVFEFDDFVQSNLVDGDVRYVWVSEDDTKINEGLAYDKAENIIVGFVAPINPDHGIPYVNHFKFESVAVLQKFLDENQKSTYVKLMSVKALKPGSKSFILVLYGTAGSDSWSLTRNRWKFVYDSFKKRGINVMGFSSDGASPFLKAMKVQTAFGCEDTRYLCPQEFRGFFTAKWDLSQPCFINDSLHLVVKIMWLLMRRNLMVGNFRASKTHILDVLVREGKAKSGVDPGVITDSKDAMNYARASKLCNSNICALLSQDQQIATRTFMKLVIYINGALISTSMSPEERIHKLWYAVFFSRLWRLSCVMRKDRSLANDFLTSNAYACLEINAHNMLKFLVKCRELNKPEIFLLSFASSQPCENVFRDLRSMSTTHYTTVNFTMQEVLHKRRRLQLVEDIRHRIDNDVYDMAINSKQRKEKVKEKVFVPSSLPTDACIKRLIDTSFIEAITDAKALGIHYKRWSGRTDEILDYPKASLDSFQNTYGEGMESCDDIFGDDKGDGIQEVEDIDAIDLSIVRTEEDLDLGGGMSEHELFIANVLRCDFREDTSPPKAPAGFIKLNDSQDFRFVRKSMVLWSLEKTYRYVTTDRLQRFVNKDKVMRRIDYVMICEFVKMLIDKDGCEAEEYAFVMGFKKMDGRKEELNKSFMCMRNKKGILHEDIGVVASLYKLKQIPNHLSSKLVFVCELKEPISFAKFIKHVPQCELIKIMPPK